MPAHAPRHRRNRRASGDRRSHVIRGSFRSGARAAAGGEKHGTEEAGADGLEPLVVLCPVSRVFLQKSQRVERTHPIEKQDAVEVIGFVLDDARWKVMGAQLEALAAAIERTDLDFAGTRHAASKIRNTEAAFPSLDDIDPD